MISGPDVPLAGKPKPGKSQVVNNLVRDNPLSKAFHKLTVSTPVAMSVLL
jgi:hypothetical protein